MQHSLIQRLMLYESELNYDTMEAIKNIYCAKSKGAVDHSRITKWFKKFCSHCKNLDDQVRSGRPTTVDSEVMLQVIEANPTDSTEREYQANLAYHIQDGLLHSCLRQKHPELLNCNLILSKYCKIFYSPPILNQNKISHADSILLLDCKPVFKSFHIQIAYWDFFFNFKVYTSVVSHLQ